MNLGNTAINNFMLGNIQIDKIYMGSLAAWTSMPYVYDEDLIYDNTNIEVSFPNSGNAGIDSTGNVLTATASDGVAISILKTQDKPTTIIPLMIDNTSPLGVASDIDSSSLAWKAFDEESAALSWSRNAQGGIGWVQYDFGYSIQADSYGMIQYITDDRAIKDFIIQGSDNGSAWTTIDTQSGLTSWEYDVEKYFTLSTPETYRYWRIDITASNGNATVVLGNFRLYSELGYGDYIALTSDNIPFEADFEFANISDASTADTLRTSTPIADGDNLVIVKDDNSINEMVASGVTGTGPYSMNTSAVTAGEVPSRVYAVDAQPSFAISGGFEDAVKSGDTYSPPGATLDIDDIFSDGSILATYQFNDSMVSLSGTVDGSGSLTDYRSGQFGQSAYFSNVANEMNTPLAWSGVRAMSFWGYMDADAWYLIGSAGGTTSPYAAFDVGGGDFVAELQELRIVSNTPIELDTWTHYVVSVDEATETVTLYINATLDGTTTDSYSDSSTALIGFGQSKSTAVYGGGGIDQCRFFNRAVTQEEVNLLFSENVSALKTTRTYNDLIDPVGSQTIQTKVVLKAAGDKMTKLQASIMAKG